MAAGGGAQQSIGEVFGNRLLAVLQNEEEKLDQKLQELDDAGEDEIERMRAARLDQMKKMHKQKAEWVAQGHGSYREVEDQLSAAAFPGSSLPFARAACALRHPSTHTPPLHAPLSLPTAPSESAFLTSSRAARAQWCTFTAPPRGAARS